MSFIMLWIIFGPVVACLYGGGGGGSPQRDPEVHYTPPEDQ